MFVSPAIHGSYEFGRIAHHQYVNIYAVHQLYDSWIIVSRPGRTVRVVRVVLSRLKCSVTNDMHVTIDPRPVQPVNHCFTTCTGRTSRTSRVNPFTGRICSTVLDKDESCHVVDLPNTWKKCIKMKNARAERVKLLFCSLNMQNLWRFRCRRVVNLKLPSVALRERFGRHEEHLWPHLRTNLEALLMHGLRRPLSIICKARKCGARADFSILWNYLEMKMAVHWPRLSCLSQALIASFNFLRNYFSFQEIYILLFYVDFRNEYLRVWWVFLRRNFL